MRKILGQHQHGATVVTFDMDEFKRTGETGFRRLERKEWCK